MTVCVSVGDVNGDSVEIDVVDSVDIAGRCVDVAIGNSVEVTVGDAVDAVSVRLSADEDVIGRSVVGVVVDAAVDDGMSVIGGVVEAGSVVVSS